MRIRPATRAFTLVELLVVIGIIALLISILLPALNAARRQAAQTKCLASLKEIGNAFQLYSIDSRGFFPPAKLQPEGSLSYNIDGEDYPSSGRQYGPFWFYFISKYVQKSKVGEGDTNGAETGYMRTRSVLWGCPGFAGYEGAGADPTTKAVNRIQIGYGMNAYPTFGPNYPTSVTTNNPFGGATTTQGTIPDREIAVTPSAGGLSWNKTTNNGLGFIKQVVYGRMGASRALIADASLWLVDAKKGIATIPDQYDDANAYDTNDGQTTISMWRHGKLPTPSRIDTTSNYPRYTVGKGKMAYNILYCDGHAANTADPREAFRAVRMKYPG